MRRWELVRAKANAFEGMKEKLEGAGSHSLVVLFLLCVFGWGGGDCSEPVCQLSTGSRFGEGGVPTAGGTGSCKQV